MSEAKIEGTEIVIRLPLDGLSTALEFAPFYVNPPDDDDGPTFIVSDQTRLAESLVLRLNAEDETGDTMVTRMLDEALGDAVENGDEGIAFRRPEPAA